MIVIFVDFTTKSNIKAVMNILRKSKKEKVNLREFAKRLGKEFLI